MKIGDVVATNSIRAIIPPVPDGPWGGGWADIVSDKDRQMIFLFLGAEPKDGTDPLDPNEMLKALGWVKETDDSRFLMNQKYNFFIIRDPDVGFEPVGMYDALIAPEAQTGGYQATTPTGESVVYYSRGAFMAWFNKTGQKLLEQFEEEHNAEAA